MIFSSVEPAILVLLDGEPLMSPIRDSDLRFAVNTNWDLFELAGTFYLRNEDAWLMAPDLGGPWSPAGKLPKPFKKLPKNDGNWKDVRDSLPGRKITLDEVPHVYVSETPAELILIEGEPRFSKIENTRLLWVGSTTARAICSGPTPTAISTTWFPVAGSARKASTVPGPSPGKTSRTTLPRSPPTIPGRT